MRRGLLAFGIILLITGITLASVSSISVSHWVDFTVDFHPRSELVLNKAFAIQAAGISTYTLNLSKNDVLTINGAITQPNSNRATIDFSINDSSQIYHSYDKTSNVTLRWTVPRNGNYSFTFNNSFGDASKDVIIMVQKSWHEPQQYTMLVYTPLVSNLFLRVGVILCAVILCVVGILSVILMFRKKNTA